MQLQYPLVDVNTVETEDLSQLLRYSKLDARLPISCRDGSSAMAIHETYRPGDYHARTTYYNCEQIFYQLGGTGVAGIDEQYIKMRAGHCLHVPRGTEYSYNNTGSDRASMVSFIIGAADFGEIDGESRVEQILDESVPFVGGSLNKGTLLHVDDVSPENMDQGDGWLISDFRLPIGRHNGSDSTLFRARFLPGAVHKKHSHENCEEIYFIISGRGLAGAGSDRVEVHAGHFHYIPPGVEHWLHNLSDTEAIEVVGIYLNAGTVAETGYVYRGNVTQEDLRI